MAKAKAKQVREYVWHITAIKKKGAHLGRVHAPDDQTAIDKAIEEFGYSGDRRKLLAMREG